MIWKLSLPTDEELEVETCSCNVSRVTDSCTDGNVMICMEDLLTYEAHKKFIRESHSLLLVNRQTYLEAKAFAKLKTKLVVCDEDCLHWLLRKVPYSDRRLIASIKVKALSDCPIIERLNENSNGGQRKAVTHYVREELRAFYGNVTLLDYESIDEGDMLGMGIHVAVDAALEDVEDA